MREGVMPIRYNRKTERFEEHPTKEAMRQAIERDEPDWHCIYMVWDEDRDTGREMLGIFANETKAIDYAKNRIATSVERYGLPFTEGDVTEEVWSNH